VVLLPPIGKRQMRSVWYVEGRAVVVMALKVAFARRF
jgi:hypothetical protein